MRDKALTDSVLFRCDRTIVLSCLCHLVDQNKKDVSPRTRDILLNNVYNLSRAVNLRIKNRISNAIARIIINA